VISVGCAAAAESVLIVTARDTKGQIQVCASYVKEQVNVLIVRGQEKSLNLLHSIRCFADKIA